jgi:hypothetical protein
MYIFMEKSIPMEIANRPRIPYTKVIRMFWIQNPLMKHWLVSMSHLYKFILINTFLRKKNLILRVLFNSPGIACKLGAKAFLSQISMAAVCKSWSCSSPIRLHRGSSTWLFEIRNSGKSIKFRTFKQSSL